MTVAFQVAAVVLGSLAIVAAFIVVRWWLGWPDELIDAFLRGWRGE
jgi:hypothetical protein